MVPLPDHTVQLIIQYICPPSAIADHLPPHLLSTPLRQRHRFLAISPLDDPVAYLTWPADDSQTAADLLESLDATVASHPIMRYTGDAESIFAHANFPLATPADRLRLIFLWDTESDSWKYHNSALMPFPDPAYDTVEALMTASTTHPAAANSAHIPISADSGSDDEYWNSYGSIDERPDSSDYSSTKVDSEDDYWAQYGTVEGTADSTNPSPLPFDRFLAPQIQLQRADPAIGADHIVQISLPEENFTLGLQERLELMSLTTDQDNTKEMPVVSKSSTVVVEPDTAAYWNGFGAPQPVSQKGAEELQDAVVVEAIKGIYQVWLATNPSSVPSTQFLNLVHQALHEVSPQKCGNSNL